MPDPALTSLLGQWKAAIQAATPGPWKASSYGPGALLSPTEADGEFIAMARGAMPRLLEAVDRVLELADRLDSDDRSPADRATARMFREAIEREVTGQ